MDRQIDEAAEHGIGDEECTDAVTRLAGSFDLALEDTDFRMRRIARQAFFSGEAQDVEESRESMARLGQAEVNAICRRLLKGRARARFAYGGLSKRTAKASGLLEAKLSDAPGAARRG
jgi:predicted Zn-dependent peptidase